MTDSVSGASGTSKASSAGSASKKDDKKADEFKKETEAAKAEQAKKKAADKNSSDKGSSGKDSGSASKDKTASGNAAAKDKPAAAKDKPAADNTSAKDNPAASNASASAKDAASGPSSAAAKPAAASASASASGSQTAGGAKAANGTSAANGTAQGANGTSAANGTAQGANGTSAANGTAQGANGTSAANGTAQGANGTSAANGTAQGANGTSAANGAAQGANGAAAANGPSSGANDPELAAFIAALGAGSPAGANGAAQGASGPALGANGTAAGVNGPGSGDDQRALAAFIAALGAGSPAGANGAAQGASGPALGANGTAAGLNGPGSGDDQRALEAFIAALGAGSPAGANGAAQGASGPALGANGTAAGLNGPGSGDDQRALEAFIAALGAGSPAGANGASGAPGASAAGSPAGANAAQGANGPALGANGTAQAANDAAGLQQTAGGPIQDPTRFRPMPAELQPNTPDQNRFQDRLFRYKALGKADYKIAKTESERIIKKKEASNELKTAAKQMAAAAEKFMRKGDWAHGSGLEVIKKEKKYGVHSLEARIDRDFHRLQVKEYDNADKELTKAFQDYNRIKGGVPLIRTQQISDNPAQAKERAQIKERQQRAQGALDAASDRKIPFDFNLPGLRLAANTNPANTDLDKALKLLEPAKASADWLSNKSEDVAFATEQLNFLSDQLMVAERLMRVDSSIENQQFYNRTLSAKNATAEALEDAVNSYGLSFGGFQAQLQNITEAEKLLEPQRLYGWFVMLRGLIPAGIDIDSLMVAAKKYEPNEYFQRGSKGIAGGVGIVDAALKFHQGIVSPAVQSLGDGVTSIVRASLPATQAAMPDPWKQTRAWVDIIQAGTGAQGNIIVMLDSMRRISEGDENGWLPMIQNGIGAVAYLGTGVKGLAWLLQTGAEITANRLADRASEAGTLAMTAFFANRGFAEANARAVDLHNRMTTCERRAAAMALFARYTGTFIDVPDAIASIIGAFRGTTQITGSSYSFLPRERRNSLLRKIGPGYGGG